MARNVEYGNLIQLDKDEKVHMRCALCPTPSKTTIVAHDDFDAKETIQDRYGRNQGARSDKWATIERPSGPQHRDDK